MQLSLLLLRDLALLPNDTEGKAASETTNPETEGQEADGKQFLLIGDHLVRTCQIPVSRAEKPPNNFQAINKLEKSVERNN